MAGVDAEGGVTFAEVLPALFAGRIATRMGFKYRWVPNRLEMRWLGRNDEWAATEDTSHILASDWELVEEPAFDSRGDDRATIARLERERDLLKLTVKTCEEVSAALERELAEAKRKAAKFDTMERLLKQGGWEVK